jgi:hypothetical protein
LRVILVLVCHSFNSCFGGYEVGEGLERWSSGRIAQTFKQTYGIARVPMLAATSVENVVNAFAIIGREANCQDVYSRRKWRKHTTEQSRNSWKHTPSEFPIFLAERW